MITTQDVGQEDSRKAGELRGAGLHCHQGQEPSGGPARPQEGFELYWVGPGQRVNDPGRGWAAFAAGSEQEGLGQGPGQTHIGQCQDSLPKALLYSVTLGTPCTHTTM